MTSLMRRHSRQECEKGIDDDHDHHLVLYKLSPLEDDDNYELYCWMSDEDNRSNDVTAEQWGRYMLRSNDESTILLRLEALNRRLISTPSEYRIRLINNFVAAEYGRMQEEEMTFLRERGHVSNEDLVARMNGDGDDLA